MGAPEGEPGGRAAPADRLLQMVVNSRQFERDWAAYEAGIIAEFGSVSESGMVRLYARLQAARDFYEHLRGLYREQ